MDRMCKNCKYYSYGVTEKQRREWSGTNIGRYADGVCHLYFPRGYVGRKPPHPAMQTGACFQFESKEAEQMTIFDLADAKGGEL